MQHYGLEGHPTQVFGHSFRSRSSDHVVHLGLLGPRDCRQHQVRLGAVAPRHFCVAGVALGDIYLRFTWQAWHLATSTFVSRDTCGIYGTGSGGALGSRGATTLLRGRRGAWRHLPSFHVAGGALGDIHRRFAWQAWHLWDWAGSGGALGRRGAAPLLCGRPWRCDTFAWQAWHFATSTFVSRGRRGTWGHLPSFHVTRVAFMGLALVARLGVVAPRHFCVAGVALGDIYLRFTWQAWHLATSTVVLRGRHGTYGTGLGLVARLGAVAPRHFCVAGVALGDILATSWCWIFVGRS